ncbi:MAG: FxLYD domain-containing protein [Bryobacteraceae bacterium]|nr:FxLYD domain-containing protein [Bryobacteraceae bacterium]
MRAVCLWLLLGTLLCFAQDKRKGGKPPDVTVVEASAHRTGEKIAIEGRVRNTSPKPLKKLMLLFELLESNGKVIATKQGEIDEPLLDADGEAAFHVEATDEARAVHFRIQATDAARRDLRVDPMTPRPIE